MAKHYKSRFSGELLNRLAITSLPSEDVASRCRPLVQNHVAFIGSEELFQSLRHEFNLILLTPANWESVFSVVVPDLVLVESCFATANGFWGFSQQEGLQGFEDLVQVIAGARARGIPTVYWNTLDYVYKESFRSIEGYFDFRYHADAKYCQDRPEQYLPPAVQSAVFNPFRFSGNPDAQEVDVLFDGLVDLHRMPDLAGVIGKLSASGLRIIESRYQFFRSKLEELPVSARAVLGCVTYRERCALLKHARTAVSASATTGAGLAMQWRALEYFATRTPLVHLGRPDDMGIRESLALCVADEEELLEEVERYLEDDEYREAVAQMAWRAVNTGHSMTRRVQIMFQNAGVRHDWVEHPPVSVITPTFRLHLLDRIIEQFDSQNYPEKELILVLNTDAGIPGNVRDLERSRGDIRALQVPSENFTGFSLKLGFSAANGEICVKMDDDDYYGEHYLTDLVLSQRISRVDFFGKAPTYLYFEYEDAVYKRRRSQTQCAVINSSEFIPGRNWVGGNTIAGRTMALRSIEFPEETYAAADTALMLGAKERFQNIGIFDRSGVVAFRAEDTSGHTWQMSEKDLKSDCYRVDASVDRLMRLWRSNTIEEIRKAHSDIEDLDNNGVAPKRELVSAVQVSEFVTASLASIPEREAQLQCTIRSIYAQVDQINVFLNEYGHIPDFLRDDKIAVFSSDNYENYAAAGKFFGVENSRDGYFFTLDDDILYPANYVRRMTESLRKYRHKAIVCVHGSIFGTPLEWYFERTEVYATKLKLDGDRFVTLPGTGTMAFHTCFFRPRFSDFFPDVMCDLRIAIMARDAGLPIVAIQRKKGWLKVQETPLEKRYYENMLVDDGGRTVAAQGRSWDYWSYRNIISDWLDANMQNLSMEDAKRMGMDVEFIAALKNDRMPPNWDSNSSLVYNKRRLQFYKKCLIQADSQREFREYSRKIEDQKNRVKELSSGFGDRLRLIRDGLR